MRHAWTQPEADASLHLYQALLPKRPFSRRRLGPAPATKSPTPRPPGATGCFGCPGRESCPADSADCARRAIQSDDDAQSFPTRDVRSSAAR